MTWTDDPHCTSCGINLDESNGEHLPDCGNSNYPPIDEETE